MIADKYVILNNKVALKDEKGQINLDNLEYDHQAVKSYFIDNINVNSRFFYSTEEKVLYLIENDYWEDFTKKYSLDFIVKLLDSLYAKKFRFKSFMAASKFYQSYALKDNNSEKFLERYEDRILATALYLADGNEDDAVNYSELMINQEYQPATPTFLNSGKKRSGELVSCFLDEIGDSMQSISYSIGEALNLSSIGGGVAFNLSKLRARGEAIKGVEGRASGVLPVAKILEDSFSYADQLGQREGAGALYLNVFHSDVLEFLDSKKINVDEKIRLKTISLGLIIPDKFMELVRSDSIYYRFNPYSVYSKYGIHLDDMDMDEMYEVLACDDDIRKEHTITAKELLVKVAQIQKESGYPYLFFKGNANKSHALSGTVNFSNLCTEIMQESTITSISSYNEDIQYGDGISCVLGSVNLVQAVHNSRLSDVVSTSMRMLNSVSNIMKNSDSKSKLPPSIYKSNYNKSAVGLGAMNLHGLLALEGIQYDSLDAMDLVNVLFTIINYQSIVTSSELVGTSYYVDSKEFKYEPFIGFESSTYKSGKYFDDYIPLAATEPKTDKVKSLVSKYNLKIPTNEDWINLKKRVMTTGLVNAYRLSIAPNQSTAYIMNATPSILPITSPIETRVYGNSTTYYPAPYLSYETLFQYRSAYDYSQIDILKLVSVIQRHVDQGISTILHTNATTSISDLVKYYLSAHKLGLKALYYTRTQKSFIDSIDCIACAV
jgi:ribonucleoside-diphosphate reductase alpha chain